MVKSSAKKKKQTLPPNIKKRREHEIWSEGVSIFIDETNEREGQKGVEKTWRTM